LNPPKIVTCVLDTSSKVFDPFDDSTVVFSINT
jgi:hypothetical protein